MNPQLERILDKVQKPARYTGGEFNEIIKNPENISVRFALCFPDIYEIAMSNLGLRILYGIINELPDVWCERVFEPWNDMASEMRKHNLPLFALESGEPIKNFDLLGFSVGYEMAYPGILNMLNLAGLPLKSVDRTALSPIVFAGGTCMFNPEPLSDFIDLAVIGEGEDIDIELIQLYKTAKKEAWSKQYFLTKAAAIEGVYVPSLYTHTYNSDGTIDSITPSDSAPVMVKKRVVSDLNRSFFPVNDIVPSTEIVHDRTVLELFRGCIRGCRFCQAGYIYRPVRAKHLETLIEQAQSALHNSGYQEIGLSSLSSSDYRDLLPLCDGLLNRFNGKAVSLSLPSLRADSLSMELLARIRTVRKSGLTFAPEAGSQRLRDIINKNVTEDDILSSCRTAFEGGHNSVKLYFMIGLPGETDEDILEIAALAYKILDIFKKHARNKNRGVNITVSTACFVPKPMTPFQWLAQDSVSEFTRKQQLLKDSLRSRAIKYSWHSPHTSFIEAVLARGDRRLGSVIASVFEKSGGLNAWEDFFSFNAWMNSFSENDIDPSFYACRERNYDEIFPWSRISCGVSEEHFIRENERSKHGETTPDCRKSCADCGARSLNGGFCDE